MSEVKIKSEVKQEVEFSITTPAFFKSKDEYDFIAVIDENTTIKLTNIENSYWISKQTTKNAHDSIRKAFEEFHSITETEFIQKYDEVIESISKNTLLEV